MHLVQQYVTLQGLSAETVCHRQTKKTPELVSKPSKPQEEWKRLLKTSEL